MKRHLLLAVLVATLTSTSFAQLAPSRRPFLFKDDRGDIASARARGEHDLTVVIAAMPGANAQLARLITAMGGTIRFRDDNVDYIRARVPLDSVERLARDPVVHSLDVNMKGNTRGFASEAMADAGAASSLAPFTGAGWGPPQGSAGDSTKGVWPPLQSDYPLTHRYDPTTEMGAGTFRKEHPTWDGRGVTLALIDLNPDPLEPELQVARTLSGAAVPKIVRYETVIDPDEEDEGRWLRMNDQVTATGGTFTYEGATYKAPHDGTFRIALLDEAKFDSLSNSGLEKDLNRDGNPPGSSRLFAVIWDEQSNDVWVDTNQNLSFLDEIALTDYRVRPRFAVFGKDNPKTAVRESVGFGVQIDRAKKMVAINAGVPFHASLVVGAALGSRGLHGRYDGVAPGARLASVAEGSESYGQTEAVIRALEDPEVDAAWLEQSSSIARPYTLRDGRLVPTVIYSRLIEKYKKPLMIPTHNYPILGGSDDFVLADCGIGVGGHESRASFLANYGVRTPYADNLLITGGYSPMGNGDFGPLFISPSNVIAGYRGWDDAPDGYVASIHRLPSGYRIAGGTSTATPTASGAVALLISAAKQTGVKYDVCRIKQALAMSARHAPNIPVYKQGNGVINVAGAWEILKAMDKAGPAVAITSSAPVLHSYSAYLAQPNTGVGLYEHEGWSPGDHGQRTVTFTRTAGPAGPMTFGLSIVTGDSGTFSTPPSVTLPLNTPVSVTIGIAPRTPGVHSALVTLDNSAVPGHAYRMSATIVAAEALADSNHFKVVTKTTIPRPGMQSYFYRVPPGVSALHVVFDAPKRAAQVAFIKPDTRTAKATPIVGERAGRGGGGGGGGANARRPAETYVVENPMPGVWEVRLTDVEDTKTFDWKQSETGKPVPPTEGTLTVSALAVRAATTQVAESGSQQSEGGDTPSHDVVVARTDIALSSGMAGFTGAAMSYPLGSARVERPTIREHEQQLYEVDVPPGSTALRVTVARPSDPAADLDVYVFDCTKKECQPSSRGADPIGGEIVMIPHPAAGTWKIIVEAASVPSGTTSYHYTDVVFNQAYGMVAVNDTPSKRAVDSAWTARTSVWTASIPQGRQPFAAVLVEGQVTPSQTFAIGLFELPGQHTATHDQQR
jgi:hypothetical protein